MNIARVEMMQHKGNTTQRLTGYVFKITVDSLIILIQGLITLLIRYF